MQINDLKINTPRKKRKTVGRGGKKGTYCGKGCKGQKARSGAHVDPLFEGGRSTLIDHMKKKKGFQSHKLKPIEIKLADLMKKIKTGSEITIDVLVENKFIKKTEGHRGAKILGPKNDKAGFTFGEKIIVSKSVSGQKEVTDKK